MAEEQYTPTARFTNVNYMFGNHFRFAIDGLPHLTFYAQAVSIPSVGVPTVPSGNPFTKIPQVGDHVDFGVLDVTYLIDAEFKTYFSLFAWLRGYAFPNAWDDVTAFADKRKEFLSNVRPAVREIQKTNATLTLLQPDTERSIAEIRFYDVFPTAIGQVPFTTNPTADAPSLTTIGTFYYTNFEISLTS